MSVWSFVKEGASLSPVELEVSLVQGLPKVHVLGMPNSSIKESVVRVKAAIRAEGFRWPNTQQVLVNLKPAFVPKSSKGLDLALALAILKATGQWEEPSERYYYYGELSLFGDLIAPEDLGFLSDFEGKTVSGKPPENSALGVRWFRKLREVNAEGLKAHGPPLSSSLTFERPQLMSVEFSKKVARQIALLSVGGHSCLIAGPQGTGKSTFARAVYQILPDPSEEEFKEILRTHRLFNETAKWRPLASPHHTIPVLSMVGGGYPVFPGEVTKAHHGVLLMDEYLEFSSKVQEALREPIESGKITISRRGSRATWPARFQLIATTNLCPCGALVPSGYSRGCSYRIGFCRSYLDKLSGPMLDRLDVILFSDRWKAGTGESFALTEIHQWAERAWAFKRLRESENPEATRQDPVYPRAHLLPEVGNSRRRKSALLRVARTLADLDESLDIKPEHIEESWDLTFRPVVDLRQVFS